MPKFSFYSMDIDVTNDPENAPVPPATLVVFNRDPVVGQYDPQAGNSHRGSILPTLSGAIIQEYTASIMDQRIRISDSDALTEDNVDTMSTIANSGEWYFTDGSDVWKVRFARPRGFVYKRNIIVAKGGVNRYSYEIELIPTWKSGES